VLLFVVDTHVPRTDLHAIYARRNDDSIAVLGSSLQWSTANRPWFRQTFASIACMKRRSGGGRNGAVDLRNAVRNAGSLAWSSDMALFVIGENG